MSVYDELSMFIALIGLALLGLIRSLFLQKRVCGQLRATVLKIHAHVNLTLHYDLVIVKPQTDPAAIPNMTLA